MYRVIKMSSTVYAIVVDFDDDADNIKEFVESGDVVILCNELYELEDYGIDEDDIEIVT